MAKAKNDTAINTSAKNGEAEQPSSIVINGSFEERLGRLEEISREIKSGTIGLAMAAQLFEEGVKLAQSLESELSGLEQRVQILVNEPNDSGVKPILELFPELQS